MSRYVGATSPARSAMIFAQDSDGSEDSVDAALVPARKQARLTLEEDDGQ